MGGHQRPPSLRKWADIGTDLRVDREAQAPLVGNDEGDDGIQDGGEQRVDAKDQGTKFFRERRRNLKAEGESRLRSTSAVRDQGPTRALKARGAAGQRGEGRVGARCSWELAQGQAATPQGSAALSQEAEDTEHKKRWLRCSDIGVTGRTGLQTPHGGGGGGGADDNTSTRCGRKAPGCLRGMSTCGGRAAL